MRDYPPNHPQPTVVLLCIGGPCLQRYRPLWGNLKQQAAERAESQRRAAAAAAQAKARQASVRAASSARAPVAVVMSDKQREAVEGLMQELAAGVDLLGGGGAAAGSNSEGLGGGSGSSGLGSGPDLQQEQKQQQQEDEECAEAASQFIDGLVRGGFSAADAAAAVKAVGVAAGMAAATAATAASAAAAAGRRVTRVYRSHDGLQPYLDWLCIRLPVERLPSRYRPGLSCVYCVWVDREGCTWISVVWFGVCCEGQHNLSAQSTCLPNLEA